MHFFNSFLFQFVCETNILMAYYYLLILSFHNDKNSTSAPNPANTLNINLFNFFSQIVDPAVVDSLRESNLKLELELSNLQKQLSQTVSQLNESNEAKQRASAELKVTKEEVAAQVAQVSQKNSRVGVSWFIFLECRYNWHSYTENIVDIL